MNQIINRNKKMKSDIYARELREFYAKLIFM